MGAFAFRASGVKTLSPPVRLVKSCSCPDCPPRADSMDRTKLLAFVAGTAEVAFPRVYAILVLHKHSHRTHIKA